MASNIDIEFNEPHIARFEILGFQHGFGQPGDRSTSGGRTVEHQNLTFTRYGDEHSQTLIKACHQGQRFKSAILTIYAQSVKYMTVVMKNVTIPNFSISGGAGDLPVENISLDYGSITYDYVSSKETSPEPHELKKENPG